MQVRYEQWRNGCDDLRYLDSVAILKDVEDGRASQIKRLQEDKAKEDDENAAWQRLQDEQLAAALAKDEAEKKARHERNLSTKKMLERCAW